MTTIQTLETICAQCGARVSVASVGSTNAFGSPDLDLRPPEMQRSTMAHWLQECDVCGYVAPDLSKIDDAVRGALASPVFVELMTAIGPTPDAASPAERQMRRFRKASVLAEETGQIATAALTALWTAWAGDDAADDDSAAAARSRAADLYADAPTEQLAVMDADTLAARRIDILRRAGRFSEAADLASDLQGRAPAEPLASIVIFQAARIAAEDTGCYTVADATA